MADRSMRHNYRQLVPLNVLDHLEVDWPALHEAGQEHHRLLEEVRSTGQRHNALIQVEREKAVEADRRALATAIRDGKAEPPAKAVAKIEAEIEACERRREALDLLLHESEVAINGLVNSQREAWAEEVGELLDAARRDALEQVATLRAALTRFDGLGSLRWWVTEFPVPKDLAEPALRSVARGLTAPNGEPYRVSTLLDVVASSLEPLLVTPAGPSAA